MATTLPIRPRPLRPPERVAVGIAMLAFLLLNFGCVQKISLAPESSAVRATLVEPDHMSPVGVRASLSGTGADPTVNDWDFANEGGDVVVRTHRLGPTHLICKGIHYEVAYGPVNVQEWGKSYTVSEFTTSTTTPIGMRLLSKRRGVVKLAVFAEDWPYTRVTSAKVTGTHNAFHMTDNVYVLRDDGLMGDDKANDGVWITTFTAAPGQYGYGLIVNDADRWSRDPHEESTGIHVDADQFIRAHSRILVK